MKTCNKCHIQKGVDSFNKNPKGKLGLRSNCKDCQKLTTASWYLRNKVRKLQKAKDWKAKNPHKIKKYDRSLYARIRRASSLNHRLRCVIRERLTKLVRNRREASKLLLGCSVTDLIKHLESKFILGMTWENYGRTGWHIDHIKPLAGFDLSNPEQLKQACHYTNLQPLWASDNLRKGARSVLK